MTLPHNFRPRPYQLPILKALDGGVTRAVAVWHRRSGKDKTFLNYMAKRTAQRVGAYYYLFPTYAQAKKALWDGRDADGFRFLDHFPAPYLQQRHEQELKLTLANGSIVQFAGTDNFDSLMGTNPIGCVFSEYSLQDPRAWEYVRPILRENGGWALFNFTPRGKNHGYEIYERARSLVAAGDPAWFAQRLTVADTGVLTEADLDAERREGMSEELIAQEYFCSFEGVQEGSIFGKQLQRAEQEGRIGTVPWQRDMAVETWWDWGMDDPMAIWFTQTSGREVHVIDYHEDSGGGLPACAKHLQGLPYVYGEHHGRIQDINFREVGSGKSRLETARALALNFVPVPEIGLQEGIEAARVFMDRCWFDAKRTERGRRALISYHRTYDAKRKCFSSQPYHDWSSNAADSYRYLAVGHKVAAPKRREGSRGRVFTTAAGGGESWMGS